LNKNIGYHFYTLHFKGHSNICKRNHISQIRYIQTYAHLNQLETKNYELMHVKVATFK